MQTEPTGAADVWTSAAPAAERFRRHVDAGDFVAATADAASLPPRQAIDALDLLARFRYEFSVDEPTMLARIRQQIPDYSQDELRRATRQNRIRHKVIDGRLFYFRREPRVLIAFDADLKKRRDANRPAVENDRHGEKATIVDHLAEIVAAADRSAGDELLPVRTRVDYTITFKPNLPGAKRGSVLRGWLPFPQNHRQQCDVRLISCSEKNVRLAAEGSPHRTAYFEKTIDSPDEPIFVSIAFDYRTAAFYPRLDAARAQHGSRPELAKFARERPPHVVFTDEVKQIAHDVGRPGENPLEVAARLWRWVDDNIPWCAEHEYALIPSLTKHGLANRRGDCGVQTMVFMSLCRCAGIPTRWQSGWVTDPYAGPNMHDWCEIHIEPWGWIPADPSYGRKKHDDTRVQDFYLGHLDSYRLIINTDFGRDLDPPKQSLRSEPADFQRGEFELDGTNLYFDQWIYEFRATHEAEN